MTTLSLRFSPKALDVLDQIRSSDVTRERYLFQILRELAAIWTPAWNHLQVHGEVSVGPNGGAVLREKDIPPAYPVGDAPPDATVDIFLPDVVVDRLQRAARMNAAVQVSAGRPSPWTTLNGCAQSLLTEVLVAKMVERDVQLEKAGVEKMEKTRRVEEERLRRRAQLESEGGGASSGPEPSSGSVATLSLDPDPSVGAGSSGS
jgi:hypothetical protein